MRISTPWAQQLGVNAMNAQQVKLSKIQLQLSTGLKNLTPSDDPAAAVRALGLQESIGITEQYKENIDVVRARLSIEEGSLEAAENVMFRAKELTIQALNPTLTIEDKLAIKAEIDQLLEQMVSIANTKNSNGDYVFSGDLSSTPAIAWDTESESYVYQGGINQRTVAIAPERKVADSNLGSNVFIDIASVSQEADTTLNGTENNTRSIFNTLQSLSKALESTYEVPEATLTGDRFMRFGVDYSGAGLGATTFNLTSENGTAVPVTLNVKYDDIDAVVTAINAVPALSANNVKARSNGNQIEFISTTEGKTSSIKIDASAGSFLTDFGFTTADTANGADLGGSMKGNKESTFLNYATKPASFELNDEKGNKKTITLNTNYVSNAAMIADIQSQIDIIGSPISGKMEVAISGNIVEFKSISSGSSASVQIKQGIGDFLKNTGYTSGDTGRVYSQTANDALTDIDSALNNFLKVRTTVGARMRALDDQESQHSKFVLDMKSTLSEVQDLDFADAISRFSVEQVALQAAQQAFSQVKNLSLFNYL